MRCIDHSELSFTRPMRMGWHPVQYGNRISSSLPVISKVRRDASGRRLARWMPRWLVVVFLLVLLPIQGLSFVSERLRTPAHFHRSSTSTHAMAADLAQPPVPLIRHPHPRDHPHSRRNLHRSAASHNSHHVETRPLVRPPAPAHSHSNVRRHHHPDTDKDMVVVADPDPPEATLGRKRSVDGLDTLAACPATVLPSKALSVNSTTARSLYRSLVLAPPIPPPRGQSSVG